MKGLSVREGSVSPLLSNSEDQDEMPQILAFHQGLHCLICWKNGSEKKISLKSAELFAILLLNL